MIDDKPLSDRHAIVTGGGRGIGAAIAVELARRGATLTLMGRDQAALDRQARVILDQGGAGVLAVRCDVADEESVRRAFALSRERHPSPYILVNNAGQADSMPFLETTRDDWERMLAVNLTGPFLCIREVLPAMLEAGAGRIVNLGSTAALKGYKRVAAYCASKHGLIGLTRALAAETARRGVTVNAVCPAYTATDMATAAVENLVAAGRTPEEAHQLLVRHNPLGRLIEPREVADAVAWLCSPAATAITGQAIAVAGGEV